MASIKLGAAIDIALEATKIRITMSPKSVIEYFGSQAKTARALGLRQPSIFDWVRKGVVPEDRQYQIELATNGALRADRPACRVDSCDLNRVAE